MNRASAGGGNGSHAGFILHLTDAIRLYQTDWELPVTGKISADLIQRLERSHPATKARWQKVAKDCEVWNLNPAARSRATWTGSCTNGRASGSGKLVWRYIAQGNQKRSSYEGEFRDGVYQAIISAE